MQILQRVMRDHNVYTPIYQHTYEILQMYDTPDYTVKLCVIPGNPRRYNLPTADEIGVILPGRSDFQGDCHDIIIHLRPQHYHDSQHLRLNRISEGHAAYAPLHYVCFFPMVSLDGPTSYDSQVFAHKLHYYNILLFNYSLVQMSFRQSFEAVI